MTNYTPDTIDLNDVAIDEPVNLDWGPNKRGLVSWWSPLPQKAGTKRWEDIRGGNHGALTNFADIPGAWQPGPVGNGRGVLFDGVDDRVDCGDISHLPANARSWGGWVFLRDDTAELRCVMSHYSGSSGYNMMIDATEQISISIGVGNRHVYQYRGTLDIGKWTHLFTVSNGITLVGYKDGVEYQSRSGGNIADPSNPLWIGSDPTTAGREWPGNLTDIRIHNTALTPNEIWQLYEDGLRGYPEAFNYLTHRTTVLFSPPAEGWKFWLPSQPQIIGGGVI